jgi:hypothetical protein
MVELVFDFNNVQIATATPERCEAPLLDTQTFRGLFAWLCVPDGGCQVAEHELFEATFIEALAKHWSDVVACLTAEDLPGFADQVDRLKRAAAGNPPAAHAAVAELMYFLRGRLPDAHPLRQEMPPDGGPVAAPADLSGVADVLAGLSLPAGSLAEADPAGWLLTAPSLTERQVRELGVRPERADLIRLPGAGQRSQLPAFQFAPGGQPVPVVATVNKLLDAESDPWGVADWWLGENTWLGGVPADLIGKVADSDLVRAALAAIPPEMAVPAERREE